MRSSNGPATSLCKIVYEVSGGSVLSERSAFQVSASSFPDGLRLLACWKAASALRKLSPFLPSISPGAKPSRSSSTSVLTMIAGSLLAPCGAAPLMDSDVNAATWEDDPCLGCLCVAASAAAKENKGGDRDYSHNPSTLLPLMRSRFCFSTRQRMHWTPYGLTGKLGVRGQDCALALGSGLRTAYVAVRATPRIGSTCWLANGATLLPAKVRVMSRTR